MSSAYSFFFFSPSPPPPQKKKLAQPSPLNQRPGNSWKQHNIGKSQNPTPRPALSISGAGQPTYPTKQTHTNIPIHTYIHSFIHSFIPFTFPPCFLTTTTTSCSLGRKALVFSPSSPAVGDLEKGGRSRQTTLMAGCGCGPKERAEKKKEKKKSTTMAKRWAWPERLCHETAANRQFNYNSYA